MNNNPHTSFLTNLFKLLRPHHYVKNFFIYLPLFFAQKITNIPFLINTTIAFIAFSLIASAIYVFNDYQDIEADREHPEKKFRPLASGAVSVSTAIIIMLILFIAGFSIMIYLSSEATFILALYVIFNISYSLYLKHIAVLDVTILATGYVFRLFVGSAVTDIPLSIWIVIMTYLLALFLALAKRRDDVLIFMETGKKMRKVVDGYNLQFLDTSMSIMSSVVIVAYIMYTISDSVIKRVHNGQYLYLTSLFVILGILRYLQISFVLKDSGSPTKILLKDRFIQLTVFFWLLTFGWILY